jgi:hypothetical protein
MTTGAQNRRPPSAVYRYAATALSAAIANDADAYSKAMRSLSRNYGGDGIGAAMLAWIDTLLAEIQAPGGKAIFAPAWMVVDEATAAGGTGKINGADDTPPEARWAGRLIAARANDDEASYLAILDSAPQGERAWSKHINTLAMTVAASIAFLASSTVVPWSNAATRRARAA